MISDALKQAANDLAEKVKAIDPAASIVPVRGSHTYLSVKSTALEVLALDGTLFGGYRVVVTKP